MIMIFKGGEKVHNQELTELFKRPNIINEIKRSRLEWAGHAVRKQDSKKTQREKDHWVDQGYAGKMKLKKIS